MVPTIPGFRDAVLLLDHHASLPKGSSRTFISTSLQGKEEAQELTNNVGRLLYEDLH